MLINKLGLLESATMQTLEMVFISVFFAVLVGLPLGVFLFVTRNAYLFKKPLLHSALGLVVNVIRSVPFIILLVAIIPLTRLTVGTSIGTIAAMVPLAI